MAEYLTLKSCFDDFDGDLLKMVPGVLDVPEIRDAASVWVYTYGSTDKDKTILMHPATWNGIGSMFWIFPPSHSRDEHGWVSVGGCVTNSPLVRVSVLDAIRDGWTHGYRAMLSGELWFNPFYEMLPLLMWQRHKQDTPREPEAIMAAALDWVMVASNRVMAHVKWADPVRLRGGA